MDELEFSSLEPSAESTACKPSHTEPPLLSGGTPQRTSPPPAAPALLRAEELQAIPESEAQAAATMAGSGCSLELVHAHLEELRIRT